MDISDEEIKAIQLQLKDRASDSSIEVIAMGYLKKIKGGTGEAIMFDRDYKHSKLCISEELLSQKGIDNCNRSCYLAKYSTITGEIKEELVGRGERPLTPNPFAPIVLFI